MTAYPEKIDLTKILSGDCALLDTLLQGSIGEARNADSSLDRNNLVTRDEIVKYFTELQKNTSKADKYTVSQLLKAVLPDGQKVPQQELSVIRFVDAIFNQIPKQANVDEAIALQLQRLRLPYAKLALLDSQFLASKEHPAHHLINDICEFGIGWYPGLGKSGERFMQEIVSAISSIEEEYGNDVQVIIDQQEKLKQFFLEDAVRTKKLGERQCDTEAGKLKARQAQEMAINFLNKKTRDVQLPEIVIDFLHKYWLESLKLCYLNFGNESEEWLQIREITENFVWSFKADKDETDGRDKFEIIPALQEQIPQALTAVSFHGDIESILAQIEKLHVTVLKGELPDCVDVPALPTVDAVDGIESDFTISLIDQVLCYTQGQWMLYRDDTGHWTRCQLARKIEGINQLLFLNRQGVKIMAKGLGEIAFCLSQEIAKPIEPCKAFSKAYRITLKQLLHRYSENRKSVH